MPIAKEILDMFEFSQNQKNTLSIDNHCDEWPLWQQRSVPTEPLTLSMHRYLLIKSHRKPSIALWVHPFNHKLCFPTIKLGGELAQLYIVHLPDNSKDPRLILDLVSYQVIYCNFRSNTSNFRLF